MQYSVNLKEFGPNENDNLLARDIYGKFKKYPGSNHIATEFALSYLSALMRAIKPKTVLEIGAGIGTQTYLILSHPHPPSLFVATESNQFCIDQLGRNIPQDISRQFCLVSGDEDIPQSALDSDNKGAGGSSPSFDMIVMDVDANEQLFKYLQPGCYIFVEGNRRQLRGRVHDYLEQRNLSLEFVNYNRGVRPFNISFKQTTIGIKRPKIHFKKIIKGCWIGQIHLRSA